MRPRARCERGDMTSSDAAPAALRPFIVVGFDGSSSSFLALDRGAHLAQVLGADLHVVTTWMFPRQLPRGNFGGWSPSDDAETIATDATRHLFQGSAPEWFSIVVREGMATRVLLEQSVGAEMLIVGNPGHGGFAGLLLGSVSSACAEHAACPVLIMRTPTLPSPIKTSAVLEGAHS